MSRALITGVYGQDGSLLARALASAGWEVHGTARRLESGPSLAGLVVHEADLSNAEGFVAVIDRVEPDVLVNLAGISSVAQSWEQPVLISEVSGRIVADLLEACRRLEQRAGREVRFIQASSSEIFGNPNELPQTEHTPLRPTNPYGAAKANAHQLGLVARARGQFASNAILFNHESPDRPTTFVTRKITAGVAEIAMGRTETIYLGNLDVRRDWSWAGDVIDALVLIAGAPEPDDFVVASGVARSVRDFVTSAFAAAGIADWEDRVLQDTRFLRPTDAAELCGDSTKLRTELGWEPKVSFDEMVRRMVEHDLELLRD
ncbi:MAG: GDP-mannose 4,6-dehydratase [Actinomycetota bacterium]|nr:GDP-mannose 4,6-dehydratase [Actinomycetota bacterium]